MISPVWIQARGIPPPPQGGPRHWGTLSTPLTGEPRHGGSSPCCPPGRVCVSRCPGGLVRRGRRGESRPAPPPHSPPYLPRMPTPPPASWGLFVQSSIKKRGSGNERRHKFVRLCLGRDTGRDMGRGHRWGHDGGDVAGRGHWGEHEEGTSRGAREDPGRAAGTGPLRGRPRPLEPGHARSSLRPRALLRVGRDDARRHQRRGSRAASRIAPSQDGGAGFAGLHPELHGAAARRGRRRDAAPGAGSAGPGRARRHRGRGPGRGAARPGLSPSEPPPPPAPALMRGCDPAGRRLRPQRPGHAPALLIDSVGRLATPLPFLLCRAVVRTPRPPQSTPLSCSEGAGPAPSAPEGFFGGVPGRLGGPPPA